MYDEAIEALMNEDGELALEIIHRVMDEERQLLKNRIRTDQEELDFENTLDFIPANGWEAA
jgi:hypothetical protein